MKVFVVLLLLAALVSADYVVKSHDDLLKFREECVNELKVPADHVDKFKAWNFPDDNTTHCYMKCILEKFGLFNAETGFNVHNVHTQIAGSQPDHDDETHNKIQKCADNNPKGADVCEWAYRGAMCFMGEHLPLVKKSVHAHDHDHSSH